MHTSLLLVARPQSNVRSMTTNAYVVGGGGSTLKQRVHVRKLLMMTLINALNDIDMGGVVFYLF